jgi:phenylacetate-coenzyme A ligase PaaK-like adenylate-forming protein
MKLNFSSFALRSTGFSGRPMGFLAPDARSMLAGIAEVALIETGSAQARETWQATQLSNLLHHASQRSEFWRKRIGSKKPSDTKLRDLPILTRQDVVKQVTSEGSLLRPSDGMPTHTHATSGSTGVPVHFFISEMNKQYNVTRSLAQYFMEGRDLSFNRTELKLLKQPVENGYVVEKYPSWLGPLATIFSAGTVRYISYLNANMAEFVEELKAEDIGYLVCNPRIVETIFSSSDPRVLTDANIRMWIARAEAVSPELRQLFAELKIPIRANYSSEENGPIAFQCEAFADRFHVATSNVIVEIGDQKYEVDGAMVGKILVTHLHSYATPFIRYDLGDLGCLSQDCPCGHGGPTIHDLQGRSSSLLRHRDGRLSGFHIRGQQLSALAEFAEYRIRQTDFAKIVIEIGGRSELRTDEIVALTDFLQYRAGPEFEIEVRACREIDWGHSVKRLGFISEVQAKRS